MNNGKCVTYCNHSLNQSSFIDHVFVSNSIRQDVIAAETHDTGVNFSDHIPVIFTFRWALSPRVHHFTASDYAKHSCWRWDKSDVNYYYDCTARALCNFNVPDIHDCDIGCHHVDHIDAINSYYENIVAALNQAASIAIQRVPSHSLKPYWNDELDRLKNDSIFWHNLWDDAGKPSSGILSHIRL